MAGGQIEGLRIACGTTAIKKFLCYSICRVVPFTQLGNSSMLWPDHCSALPYVDSSTIIHILKNIPFDLSVSYQYFIVSVFSTEQNSKGGRVWRHRWWWCHFDDARLLGMFIDVDSLRDRGLIWIAFARKRSQALALDHNRTHLGAFECGWEQLRAFECSCGPVNRVVLAAFLIN